jgi:hypothetical protein
VTANPVQQQLDRRHANRTGQRIGHERRAVHQRPGSCVLIVCAMCALHSVAASVM